MSKTIPGPFASGCGPVVRDDASSTNKENEIIIQVLDHDDDSEGELPRVLEASDGCHGKTRVNADGTITYVPHAGFSGDDTFFFQISDGQGGIGEASATVTVGGAYA